MPDMEKADWEGPSSRLNISRLSLLRASPAARADIACSEDKSCHPSGDATRSLVFLYERIPCPVEQSKQVVVLSDDRDQSKEGSG